MGNHIKGFDETATNIPRWNPEDVRSRVGETREAILNILKSSVGRREELRSELSSTDNVISRCEDLIEVLGQHDNRFESDKKAMPTPAEDYPYNRR